MEQPYDSRTQTLCLAARDRDILCLHHEMAWAVGMILQKRQLQATPTP